VKIMGEIFQFVAPGVQITFTAIVSGTGPLSYQWFYDVKPFIGQTNAALSLVNVQASDQGDYAVTVSSMVGAATSQSASLLVVSSPTITAYPQSVAAVVHGTATFTVAPVGAEPLSYSRP